MARYGRYRALLRGAVVQQMRLVSPQAFADREGQIGKMVEWLDSVEKVAEGLQRLHPIMVQHKCNAPCTKKKD